MALAVVAQAAALFAVTNLDDLVVLTLFFGRAHRHSDVRGVVLGQYLGLAAVLVLSLAAALGARLLPDGVIPYLGVLPLAVGLREGWEVWRDGRATGSAADDRQRELRAGAGAVTVAAVTVANGADNLAVYVPVFAISTVAALMTYVAVFLLLVAVWCGAAYALSRHRHLAPLLSRWGDVLLPVVLVGLGIGILVQGLHLS